MKKLFIPFFCIIFILCSCQKIPSVTAVTKGISFNAQLDYNGTKNNYFVVIEKNGKTVVNCTDNNITYTFIGDFVEAEFDGISTKYEISALNEGTITDFFYAVFSESEKIQNDVRKKGDALCIQGKTNKYLFALYLAGTGLPLKIEEKNFGITATLSKITVL